MADAGQRPRRPGDGVVRDSSWNLREFGNDKWPAVAALIEEARRQEDPPRLSRVLSYVADRERGPALAPLVQQPAVISEVELSAPQSIVRGAFQALVVDTVREACRSTPELVVELGSGWGRNLFYTWLAGGPETALYVGAELTGAGRAAAEALARLEPALRYLSLPFDLNDPDLGSVSGHERAVVFTVHAIDYAPELKVDVIDEIRSLASAVTCVHFENFGWQLGGGGAAEAYARENDYNRNLHGLLVSEHDAGRLRLETVLRDVVGFHSGYRASVAVWHARS